MIRTIHHCQTETGSLWTVVSDPMDRGHQHLVKFVRQNRMRKSVDQIAEWHPNGWNHNRWVPRPPTVPAWLLKIVEDHMRREVS